MRSSNAGATPSRRGRWPLLAMLVLAALPGVTLARSSPAAPQTVQQRLADLDALDRRYVDRAPAFSPAARASAHELILSTKSRADTLSDTGFFLAVARVIALADNGHDSIDPGDSNLLPPLALPVRLVWMGSDLVITRAQQGYAELVGSRIERIGAFGPEELFKRYRQYQGGNEDYRRVNTMWLLNNPAVLAAMGVTPDMRRIPISVELASGKHEARSLDAIPAGKAPHLDYPAGLWSTEASPTEKNAGWTTLNIAPPLYLQEPEKYFRVAELPQLDSLYIQLRANMNEPGQPIEPFIGEVSKRLESRPINAIVDLRFDTGGDITTTIAMMRKIGRLVRGHIFVITSPYTFSAGIVSTAAVIQSGGRKVTVVGDGPGDRTHWWSERKPFCLPHSKVCAPLQMGYWDLVHGCRSNPRCYGDQFGIRVSGIRPTVSASASAADWKSGQDRAMVAIASMLGKSGPHRSR